MRGVIPRQEVESPLVKCPLTEKMIFGLAEREQCR